MNRRELLIRAPLAAAGAIAAPLASLAQKMPAPTYSADALRKLMRPDEVAKLLDDPGNSVWVGWLVDSSGKVTAWISRDGGLWRIAGEVFTPAGVAR